MTHKTCKKWFQKFRYGDFDLSDRERPGQPKKFEEGLECNDDINPMSYEGKF